MTSTAEWENLLASETQASYLDELETVDKADKKKTFPIKRKFEIISNVLSECATLGLEPRKKWDNDAQTLDLIKIFNPNTLTWENIKYVLTGCLSAVDILYTPTDVTKLASFIFERLRNSKTVIEVPEPYSGSRYILFNNGIFDCSSQELIEIKPAVATSKHNFRIPTISFGTNLEIDGEPKPLIEVGFTEKHKHFIDLDLNADVPTYKGYGQTETWDPQTWLLKTANNKPEIANYILEIIGMMLVPNHWFNAFIEINGKSGSGKTVITNIAKSIYNGNDIAIPEDFTIDQAQDNFPFRGLVNPNTALVHITEINGSYLNANMISLFNSFANSSMEMKQMGDVSVKLTPPPLLVIEGVAWAKFDNTKTGVSRRLLPLDLTESDTRHYRSLHGKDIFRFKKVIKWFAKEAVLAFANMTKGDDHFQFSIDDPETLPTFAQKWHMMAINAGDDLMNTFMLKIKESLHNGFLQLKMMFELYNQSVLDDDPDRKHSRKFPSFRDALKMYLQEDFNVEVLNDLQYHNQDDLGIDLEHLEQAMNLPKDIQEYDKNFNKRSPYWLKITKKDAR